MTTISIIIPVLNEGARLAPFLDDLLAKKDNQCELIGVDGGSTDDSLNTLRLKCDRVIESDKGRSIQMNAGAKLASGDILFFLHADTAVPAQFCQHLRNALHQHEWGRFNAKFDTHHLGMALIATLMNIRSRLTKVSTGDQGLFFKADFFHSIGGFPPIALMEDVAISKHARNLGKFYPLKATVITSARKWQAQGIISTVLLMWRLRLAYFLGASPESLAKKYYG